MLLGNGTHTERLILGGMSLERCPRINVVLRTCDTTAVRSMLISSLLIGRTNRPLSWTPEWIGGSPRTGVVRFVVPCYSVLLFTEVHRIEMGKRCASDEGLIQHKQP